MKKTNWKEFFNEEFKINGYMFKYRKKQYNKFLFSVSEKCNVCGKFYYTGCKKRCNCI